MNLLEAVDDDTFSLRAFSRLNIPPYAILSHTWGRDEEEVTFEDMRGGTGRDKAGYQKLRFCGHQTRTSSLRYFWVDTCCINKSDSSELQRSINSMFRWYQNASRCYVYLSDVSLYTQDGRLQHVDWESAFRNSRWFTRGWTLQELIAPKTVEFYSRDRIRLGDKHTLEGHITQITGIAKEALRGRPLSEFSLEDRFHWAEKRQTAEEEDKAYCLLGIFNTFLPLIYGEGESNAMRRLFREIQEANPDSPQRFTTQPRSINRNSEFSEIEDPNKLTLAGHEKKNPSILFLNRQILEGHTSTVNAVAFSPDGKLLASASYDCTVMIWDGRSGAPWRTLNGHIDPVVAVAFSLDGKLLASASYDSTVKLWDSRSGVPLKTFMSNTGALYAVAFSPNGKLLASAANDGTVRLWDGEGRSEVPLQTLKGHTEMVRAVAFSPNGKLLASASNDDTVRLWDGEGRSGAPLKTLVGHTYIVCAVAFSPNGKLLASASGDGSVRLWDGEGRSGAPLKSLVGHTGAVLAVVFSPDGKLLASASRDSTVRLWDGEGRSGVPLQTLEGRNGAVHAVAFSPDGKLLALGGTNKVVIFRGAPA